jgi:hypothetical protein
MTGVTDIGGIDQQLHLALAAWLDLPSVERQIDSWTWLEAVDVIEEWPIQEDRLSNLRAQASAGEMSTEQLCQFAALERVVAAHRPIIDRLLQT